MQAHREKAHYRSTAEEDNIDSNAEGRGLGPHFRTVTSVLAQLELVIISGRSKYLRSKYIV
jgi:hypothetical protein